MRTDLSSDSHSCAAARKRGVPLLMGLIGLLIQAPEVGTAAVDAWTSEGPQGAAVTVLAFDPVDAETSYIGTTGAGVFKSTDGGATWSAARNGLTDGSMSEIATDPDDPQTLYAIANQTGSSPGGAFKTTDGGSAWVAADVDLPEGYLQGLTVDADNPETLYVIVADSDDGGVFKSTDGAATWDRVLAAPGTGGSVTEIAIDPSDALTLLAATRAQVLKSTNGGESWNPATSGPITGDNNDRVAAFAFDPFDSSTVYAGIQGGFLASGVYKSTNGGSNWEPTGGGEIGANVKALIAHPTAAGTIFALHGEGVFKTTDGGTRWELMNSGLPPRRFRYNALALAPGDGEHLQVGMGAAAPSPIHRSLDGAATWEPLAATGLTNTFTQSLAVDPANSQVRYATAELNSTDEARPTWKSGPASTEWVKLNGIGSATLIAVHPVESRILYAGTRLQSVLKSSDTGATWQLSRTGITDEIIRSLSIDPTDPRVVYTCGETTLFKSTDDGMLWSAIDAGMQDEGASREAIVHAVAIDPSSPATVYAGTLDQGVFKSTDGGGSWHGADDGIASAGVPALAVDPRDSQILYAGARSTIGSDEPGGIYKSVDGGSSWTPASGGEGQPLGDADIRVLAVDSSCPQIVYAATDIGVFRSVDHAASWTAVDEGLFCRDVRALVIDPANPAILHAATFGGGVFSIEQSLRTEATFCAPTPTPTPTLTRPDPTPTQPDPTPTATISAVCVGDCDGDGAVRVNELIQAVRIALQLSAADTCSVVDADQNGLVRVDELIRAVRSSLDGC